MAGDTDRRKGGQPRRRNTKKLVVLFLVILLAGLGTGVGMNFLFGKPSAKKADVASGGREDTSEKGKSTREESSAPGRTGSQKAEVTTFSSSQAMSHIFALSERIGKRRAGSVKESGTADYIIGKLAEYGYNVEEQPFTMSDGFGSRNIIGTKRGTREGYIVVISAHYDSPRGSKGADDDASGVGVVLELARVFSNSKLEPTLQFTFFGANRPGGGTLENRLVGARTFEELLGTLQRKEIISMIEVDSVGQGEVLALRTQGSGLQRLKDKLATFAGEKKIVLTSLKSTDDSDNIPFENAGVPAVWVEWCETDGTLSTDNAYTSVDAAKVETVGTLIENFVKDLSSDDLEELKY